VRSKWFGDFNARIEMDRNRSKQIEIDRNDWNRLKWVGESSKWLARGRNRNAPSTDTMTRWWSSSLRHFVFHLVIQQSAYNEPKR
jgi:hypothetical protein